MNPVQIVGRSSSHFTRVPLIFARELGVPFELLPVYDMTDLTRYGGNPAFKLPTLRTDAGMIFGAENICRKLADLAESPLRIVWPEQLRDDVARNAQEMVWHGMAAEVQIIFGTVIAKLPADNLYFTKCREGFAGALRWLDDNLAQALDALPSPRDLSLLEVTLFCLVEHVAMRETVPLQPYPALRRFAEQYALRPAARDTAYRFDPLPAT
jgi:glutathione S-transferase